MAIGLDVVGAVLAVGVAMTVAGALPMYKGWQRRERYHLVRDTPTETPETASAGETVLLTGTARAHDAPVTAPLSGGDALVAAWSIREWQDESSQSKYWSPEARGLRSAPVRIEAGDDAVAFPGRSQEGTTGAVTSLVGYDAITGFDVDDTLVEAASFDTTEEVPQADDPPDRFRDLERRVNLDPPESGLTLVDLGRTHGTRQYREVVVEEGDAVTVRGTVRTAKQPNDSPVLAVPEDGPAIVSNLDADALARRYRWSYWTLFYGTIVVILGTMLFAALALTA
jgi:hypothetical protein